MRRRRCSEPKSMSWKGLEVELELMRLACRLRCMGAELPSPMRCSGSDFHFHAYASRFVSPAEELPNGTRRAPGRPVAFRHSAARIRAACTRAPGPGAAGLATGTAKLDRR